MALRDQDFWDNHYELELKNYEEEGDEGDIWFGKRLCREIVTWITDYYDAKFGEFTDEPKSILEIGCGNAHLLCEIARQIKPHVFHEKRPSRFYLTGLDYSSNSVKLSNKIVADRNFKEVIQIKQCDFLDFNQVQSVTKSDKYDVIIDKGTYDAICLLAEGSEESLKKSKLDYLRSLYSLVGRDSIFVLASCNNTKSELLDLMSIDCDGRRRSRLIHQIKTPTIKFGGSVGSRVTCLIFAFR